MMILRNWSKSFACEAEHGLQFVSLSLMHDQAKERGVPLLPLGNSFNDITVRISGDLLAYYNQIKDAPHASDPTSELNIRRKHAHMSVGNSAGMGPEPSGRRRIERV